MVAFTGFFSTLVASDSTLSTLCMYFLLYLSSFGQFEESMGRVEEARLEEEDKGNPLVVGLVLHLDGREVDWLKLNLFSPGRRHSGEVQRQGG